MPGGGLLFGATQRGNILASFYFQFISLLIGKDYILYVLSTTLIWIFYFLLPLKQENTSKAIIYKFLKITTLVLINYRNNPAYGRH